MIRSITLNNCNALEDVIDLINEKRLSDFNAETLAAQYAIDAAIDSKYMNGDETHVAEMEFTDYELEFHLDILVENGAIFKYEETMDLIKSIETYCND